MYSSVTHIFSTHDRSALAERIDNTVAQSVSPFWTPGWPNEIEAALLDGIFSARSTYGGQENGVRRVISRWREHRRNVALDDLSALAAFVSSPDDLAEVLGNRQRVAGNSTTKAEAAARVAADLLATGVRTAEDLLDTDEQRQLFIAVPGLGIKTWECTLFLAGRRTLDALTYLNAFASEAVGRSLDGGAAEVLFDLTAQAMDVEPASLEHAVWRYQRRVGLPAPPITLSHTG